MRNFTLLLTAMLMISFSALAKIKMIVHLNDAEPIEVYASSVDSITFANFPVDPDDEDWEIPEVEKPGRGKTTIVLYVPDSDCDEAIPYIVGYLPAGETWSNGSDNEMESLGEGWWKVTLDALTPENATNFTFRMEDGEGGWTYVPMSSYELLEGADDYLHTKVGERNNLVAIDDCSNKVLYIKSGKWSFTPCNNPIPAGYAKFVLTVKNKIPNNAKIIFTGSFAEKLWGESDRVMTKEADGIYTWEGYYPENFKFNTFIIDNCNNGEWMTIGSGVSTYFVMESNAGSEIEFSGTFDLDLPCFDEEDDDEYFTPDANGYEYVDLGLPSGTLWATMNVGADSPEDYGDYFAWGETQPKSYYDWSTYKWCEGDYDTQTKYCTDSYYGTVDNRTILELSDDVANANWGGSWRMPTQAEQVELRTECTWTWEQKNGVNGYTVTGPNGNSIFLPAAGCRSSSYLYNAGSYGYYWSSSLNPDSDYSDVAYELVFGWNNVGRNNGSRFGGQSVRPVLRVK